MVGFVPEKISVGVLSGWRLVERKFRISAAALTASPHKCPGRALSKRRQRVMSRRDLLRLSATSFRCGV